MVSCNGNFPEENIQDDTVVIEQKDSSEILSNQKKSFKEKPVCESKRNNSQIKSDSDIILVDVPDIDIMGIMVFEPDTTSEVDTNMVMHLVSEMPKFPGGIDSLFSFLGKNIHYPEWEKNNNIQGKVYVNFIVEKDGSINEVKILRSVKGAKNFDKEVIRVMELMPKWIPGEHKGKKVKVSYNLPINFSLKGNK